MDRGYFLRSEIGPDGEELLTKVMYPLVPITDFLVKEAARGALGLVMMSSIGSCLFGIGLALPTGPERNWHEIKDRAIRAHMCFLILYAAIYALVLCNAVYKGGMSITWHTEVNYPFLNCLNSFFMFFMLFAVLLFIPSLIIGIAFVGAAGMLSLGQYFFFLLGR